MSDIKILIVDDILHARLLYKETLSSLPVKIFEAQNGFEFLHYLFLEHPDIALVDVNLPDISGIDLVKTVRQSDFSTEIIVITAQKDSDTIERLAKYKIFAYLVKPIDVDNLLSKVKQILKNKGILIDTVNKDTVSNLKSEQFKSTVLIIEDRANTRLFLQEVVEEEGYKSISAITGEDAWHKILNEKIDLIILDLGLPDISGFEIVDRMRKYEKNIPIIVVTGRDEEDIKKQISNYNIDNVLYKPLDVFEIHNILRLNLNIKEKTKELLISQAEAGIKEEKPVKYFYTMLDLIRDLWKKIGGTKEYYIFLNQAKTNNYNYDFLFNTLIFLVGRLGERSFSLLSYGLTCGNNRLRESICDVLGDIGKNNVKKFLIDALSDENHIVRIGAIESLEKIKDKNAIKNISKCLSDNVYLVRIKAANILLNYKMYEFLKDIINNLAGHDNNLNKKLIEIISSMKLEQILNSFSDLALSPISKVRELFLDILSNKKELNEQLFNLIIKLLDDKEETVELAAIEALVTCEKDINKVEIHLMKKLNSTSAIIQRYVSKQLKIIGKNKNNLDNLSAVQKGQEEGLIDTIVTIIESKDKSSLDSLYSFLKSFCGKMDIQAVFKSFMNQDYEPLSNFISIILKNKCDKNLKSKIYNFLESKNNYIFQIGMLFLKFNNDKNDIEIFKKYIQSDNIKNKILAYDCLLYAGNLSVLDFVFDSLKQEKDNNVLSSVFPLFINFKSDNTINFLLNYITYPNDIIIIIVIEVLASFKDKRIIPILKELKFMKKGRFERNIHTAINNILG